MPPPLPFAEIATLLSRLEDIELHEPPILAAAERHARSRTIIESWFKSHRSAIDRLSAGDAVALLSTLLPERRPDRVYSIQSPTLCRILSRCLGLSAARAKDLHAYKHPGGGDLGVCLERVLSFGGPPAQPMVCLTEVDDMLGMLASTCRFSGPDVKLTPASAESRDLLIATIIKRLDPSQAKWLVRLILKDFRPVELDDTIVLRCFHFMLPGLLRFQNTFESALKLLKGPLREFPSQPDPRSQRLFLQSATLLLEPDVGVKVGRPIFVKGRSIDSCMRMCADHQWILERKYDGEYCEVHIDRNRSPHLSECIKIFSKSGKDSTIDRKNIHQTLIDSLGLSNARCKIKHRAIILGELVVYSNAAAKILPFDKVRKHVTRSGVFLGTDEDSPPDHNEHLSMVFFDILLLDNEVLMKKPLQQRRERLRDVYTKIPGRATGAEWKIVDFRCSEKAKRTLIQQFAASIASRCEGLILKPCCDPYFSLDVGDSFTSRAYIKLKKDYIQGLGDEADFAVIGASYDAQKAMKHSPSLLKWTSFHLGCLKNKEEVLRFEVRPCFKVVATIHAQHCIPRPVLEIANRLGAFSAKPFLHGTTPAKFDVECAPPIMDTVFETPFVFEVLGSGFDKPSNSSFLMLRHPRVKKVHQDRSWKDCISMDELQEQAKAARDTPIEGESQETVALIQKLEAKCRKRTHRNSGSTPGSGSKAVTGPLSACSTRERLTTRKDCVNQTIEGYGTPDCSKNGLDETNLINTASPRLKRPHEITSPLDDCEEKKNRKSQLIHGPTKDIRTGSVKSIEGTTPLSDLTDRILNAPPDRKKPCRETIGYASQGRSLKAAPLQAVSTAAWPLFKLFPPTAGYTRNVCTATACIFAMTVAYASECITSTPYIMCDLLPSHNITIVSTLEHWNRDSLAHCHGIDVVSESQAYVGMRKIVLVERMRPRVVRNVVTRLLGLNNGRFRETVEVWDWRILEVGECRRYGKIAGEHTSRHFLGATKFDEMNGRTTFRAFGCEDDENQD